MVFSSTVFIFVFLPLTFLGYFIIDERYKNYWLLFVSLVFFGWLQPKYLWIIILNIVVNYSCAMLIGNLGGGRLRKTVLIGSLIANLSILFYFKYFDFAISSINKIVGSELALREIILPIGISFFTFQGMSYVIDVYRKDVPVQKNIFKVGLYIVLFPQLVAGPIVRYKDIASEINARHISLDDFSYGIERFIWGLGKKVIIANTMASLVDSIWNNGAAANTWTVAWIGSIAYTLQIYFDFSGYSDMAIGLGRMFGFHFNENFKLPYISKSISEFWRRWHISLSSWFRDYVYIPLGGNKKNVYLNLSIVFLLTGIWHGASWHFIVWGIWNGFFILLERLLKDKSKECCVENAGKNTVKCMLMRLYTLAVVNFGWILFRAPHTRAALQYIATMFGIIRPEKPGFTLFWYLDRWTLTIMFIGILFATTIPSMVVAKSKELLSNKAFVTCKLFILIFVFYFSIMRIVSGTYNPFIYFQF